MEDFLPLKSGSRWVASRNETSGWTPAVTNLPSFPGRSSAVSDLPATGLHWFLQDRWSASPLTESRIRGVGEACDLKRKCYKIASTIDIYRLMRLSPVKMKVYPKMDIVFCSEFTSEIHDLWGLRVKTTWSECFPKSPQHSEHCSSHLAWVGTCPKPDVCDIDIRCGISSSSSSSSSSTSSSTSFHIYI